jgi:two-component sensor histidine kinase
MRAHALLDSDIEADAPVLLGDLIKSELAPYLGEAIASVEVSCPEIKVSGDQAIALGLALNELALNAARSGLLISARARLGIRCREENRVVMIEWAETGGPAARQSASDGLNTLLIKKLVKGQLKGNLRGALVSGGVTCFIEFPNKAVREFPANG